MIKLGQRARDTITGFEGIATSRVEYLNGCIQYCIRPTQLEKGEMIESQYIDEGQLEIVKEEKDIDIIPKPVGGEMANTPKSNYRG
jgi:hypothetical protein